MNIIFSEQAKRFVVQAKMDSKAFAMEILKAVQHLACQPFDPDTTSVLSNTEWYGNKRRYKPGKRYGGFLVSIRMIYSVEFSLNDDDELYIEEIFRRSEGYPDERKRA
jgi:hypothetical protein